MIFIKALLFTLVVTAIILAAIVRSVHKQMTIKYTNEWDYGTYSQFKEEFLTRTWSQPRNKSPDSFFDASTNSQVAYDIIDFNRKGMVLSTVGYARASLFLYLIRQDKRTKGLWKKKRKPREGRTK